MSTIDIVLGALLIFGLVRGFMKGLFVEVASIISLIAGVYGAIHFSDYVANKLKESVDWEENYINIVAFTATFFVIIVVVSLAGKAFTKLANFASLGILNKLMGAVFGALKFGLIASVILIIFAHANSTIEFIQPQKLEKSVLYKPVKGLATMIFPDIIKQEKELRKELLGD
jgi:membrane protein required for colicin V production